jgi:S1-C subfamily serine protease
MVKRIHKLAFSFAALSFVCVPAYAQQAAPVASPAPATTSVSTMPAPARPAPQVNAVIYRLNGFKVLNLLRRKGAKIAPLDDAMLIADDMHTSITAGFSLEDGSVVTRLPQAEMEVPMPPSTTVVSPAVSPNAPNLFETPSNLLVVQRDGQQLPAKFIGMDGGTGLSLLQVYGLQPAPSRDVKEETLELGQRVRLLAPARAPQAESVAPDKIFFSVGELEGKLTNIARTASGHVTGLTVSAENLSPVIVGGVALNEAGETIGIVESSGANQVNLIPVAAVRRAVNRIRMRLSSKPQPWLGARGEAVTATSLEQLMSVGWKHNEAFKLMNQRLGVLLTSVPPNTPAWFADLRSGDVVMRVNAGEIKSAEGFSSLLKEAGGGVQVRFTVLRPNRPAPRVVKVTLSEALNPVLEMEAAEERAARLQSTDPLVARGLETLAVTPKFAAHLKAHGGLLVLSVHPESAASRAGLLAGDVIESVDGKILTETNLPATLPAQVSLGIVRGGQKMEVKLSGSDVKQQ